MENFSAWLATEGWTWLFVVASFGVYLYIGLRSRVDETKDFYIAGQGIPAIANGAATAADWMSAASFLSMAGLISFLGADGSKYLLGWTGGYVLLALLLAPYLRKYGKFTVPDFVGDRYYSNSARSLAAVCAIFVSLTYVIGQMKGVGIVFARYLHIADWQGVVVGMVIVAVFAVVGGMKGITWTQVVQYGILILAYVVPAIFIANIITGNPVPQIALTTSDAVSRLDAIHKDLGFAAYSQSFSYKDNTAPLAPLSGHNMFNMFAITFALMVGTAGLPHVIVRFYTTPNVRAARYSAFWAILFIALLYTTAPAVAVFARLNLIDSLHNKPIAEAKKLDWFTRWETAGQIKFVDKPTPKPDGKTLPPDGIITIAPGDVFINGPKTAPNLNSRNELYVDKDMMVLANPEIAKLSPIVIGLVVAGGLAAALSTAAALLLVISSSIAHDLYVNLIDPKAPEKKRIAIGRIVILFAIIVAGYFGINPPGYVAEVVAFAFGLAAASFFPVILLGIFDKRMNREGAITGMLVGSLVTAGYIVLEKFIKVDMQGMLGGYYVSSEGIGTIGCFLNIFAALIVSRLTPPPPKEVQDFVEYVRRPSTD